MAGWKYTDQQIMRAAELREQGLSFGQIARKTGMNEHSVYWHCLKLGAEAPGTQHYIETEIRGPLEMRRGNHVVRRFTPDEDRHLLELEAAGMPISKIAKEMKRKPNSIRGRLATLARREARIEAREEAA